jgi:hypothetical protein
MGGAAAVALFTLPTLADDSKSDATPPVSTPNIVFRSLPTGHVSTMPSDSTRPASIAPGSKADGIWVVRQPRTGMSADIAEAYVVGSEAMAKSIKSGSFSNDEDNPGCIMTSMQRGSAGDDGGPWQSFAESRNQIDWRASSPKASAEEKAMNPRVHSAHVERFSKTPDGKATLDWADAWIDPVSAGAKSIAKGSLSLAKVATGPSGLEVFAAKEDGWVHFVVRTGEVKEEDAGFLRSMAKQIQATLPNDFGGMSTDCGFMRVSLPAGAKSNDMATFETEAVLPPAKKPGADSTDPTDMASKLRALREIRRRQLLVNVSTTQSSADKEPVVSVAFGWGGPEEGQ